MKICIINNIYPPYHRGGAEQVVVQTVKGLRERGHIVVVITSTPGDDEIEEKDGVKIYRINPKMSYFYTDAHEHGVFSRIRWHVENIWNKRVAARVDEIFAIEKPDVVHTHNLMGLSFLIPKKIRARNIRHIHTIHDVQLVEPSGMILKTKEHSFRYHGPHTWLYSSITKNLFGSPDVVISPSKFLLDFYRDRGFFGNSNCIVIRNPLTFSAESVYEKKENAKLVLLYVGQIEYHKGITVLIDTVEKLHSDEFELHIAGGGSLLEEIKKRTEKLPHVHIHGRVEKEKLRELYKTADITVVPSLCYENSPTVIFESFSFHTPVLASKIEGIAELIEEGKNGITCEAGNVNKLAEKIIWSVSHRSELERMRNFITIPQTSNKEYITSLEESYSTLS
ncbi:MAG TPA: glycosyltransferase family 4 protein [Candidatus Magasanikbacteria bacterium]|nr:glycosyltransferase family 4 protein [Candidatus Magasanikbacteria bacterium]